MNPTDRPLACLSASVCQDPALGAAARPPGVGGGGPGLHACRLRWDRRLAVRETVALWNERGSFCFIVHRLCNIIDISSCA